MKVFSTFNLEVIHALVSLTTVRCSESLSFIKGRALTEELNAFLMEECTLKVLILLVTCSVLM